MTNNEVNDIDVDSDGDFDKDTPKKASLKETWESSPTLKIAAIALGGLILAGGYMAFFSGGDDAAKVLVSGGDDTVKATAGAAAPDQVYEDALKAKNTAELKAATDTGGSFIPQDISGKQDDGIQIPTVAAPDKANPLDEWRARAEAKRLEMEDKAVEEDNSATAEVVPLVQPVRPQAAMKQDPAVGQRLAEQMRVIIAAQMPPKAVNNNVTILPSAFTVMVAEREELRKAQKTAASSSSSAGGGSAASGSSSDAVEREKVIVPAGSIVYAQLVNELNSDVNGPAMAQVLSGPFRGGRALGSFQKQDEYLTLTFNRIVKDGVVYSVNGIALDEDTTLPAHQTDVDHHYWSRVILPAAAAFIQGYASAVAETGTTQTTTAGGGVASDTPEPDANEEVMKGVESAAGTISSVFQENADKETTVIVAKGTTMGILFMDSVKTGNAE